MNSRRDFLQKLTGSAIAFSFLPNHLLAEESTVDPGPYDGPMLRVAIMGLGSYGTRVAEAMQTCKKARLVGVISGTPSKVKAWKAKDGQEMVDASKQAKVRLLVGYRMHFEPHTLEIIGMRKAGEFGKPLFFQGLSGFIIGDPTQWRLNKQLAGGGAMMDIGIYSINGSRYMIGEDPIWVTAQETNTNHEKFKEGVDETIQFQLGFPGGAVASCLSTYNMNFLDRFFLNGSSGFAELLPATGYGPIKGHTNKGELNQPTTTHQTVQMDEMAGIILEGKQPIVPVDGEEGVKDMKIIDAIFKAAKTGKKVDLHL